VTRAASEHSRLHSGTEGTASLGGRGCFFFAQRQREYECL